MDQPRPGYMNQANGLAETPLLSQRASTHMRIAVSVYLDNSQS